MERKDLYRNFSSWLEVNEGEGLDGQEIVVLDLFMKFLKENKISISRNKITKREQYYEDKTSINGM